MHNDRKAKNKMAYKKPEVRYNMPFFADHISPSNFTLFSKSIILITLENQELLQKSVRKI